MDITVIILAFLLAALVSVIMRRRLPIEIVSVGAALIAFAASVKVGLFVAVHGIYEPNRVFSVDALGALLMLIIGGIGLAATIYSVPYLRREFDKKVIGFTRLRQYYILLSLFLVAMFVAVAASSPLLTWISVEATTLSTAFLISFYNKPSAMEAAWKYLIVNSIGLLLALFGTLLYCTVTQEGGTLTWQTLLRDAAHLNPALAKAAFVFVLIGYGTKIGLFPMHTWLPDAHSKAPAPVSALLSGVLLNVAFVVVLRFAAVTNVVVGPGFSRHLFMAFGLASVVFAAFAIVTQKNYKRMLAYSSIENMGIIALGIGFGGLGAFAAMLHMVYHSLIKSSLFFTAGNFLLKYSSAYIKNVRGALSVIPATAIVFLVALFAATGFPPFGIFISELYTLSAGAHHFLIVSAVLLVALVVAFLGLFRHASAMVLSGEPDASEVTPGRQSVWLVAPPIALIAATLVLSFYMPPFMLTLIHQVAARY